MPLQRVGRVNGLIALLVILVPRLDRGINRRINRGFAQTPGPTLPSRGRWAHHHPFSPKQQDGADKGARSAGVLEKCAESMCVIVDAKPEVSVDMPHG
jgi:hypothetical protein